MKSFKLVHIGKNSEERLELEHNQIQIFLYSKRNAFDLDFGKNLDFQKFKLEAYCMIHIP